MAVSKGWLDPVPWSSSIFHAGSPPHCSAQGIFLSAVRPMDCDRPSDISTAPVPPILVVSFLSTSGPGQMLPHGRSVGIQLQQPLAPPSIAPSLSGCGYLLLWPHLMLSAVFSNGFPAPGLSFTGSTLAIFPKSSQLFQRRPDRLQELGTP